MESATKTHRAAATLDRFDKVMAAVVGILVLAIGFVVLRGDQLGIGVQSFGPTDSASSRALVPLTLDQTLLTTLAGTRPTTPPAAPWEMTISQKQSSFSTSAAV